MEADWDLFAIVRGSSCHGTSTDPELPADYSLLSSEQSHDDLGFPSDYFFSNSNDGTLDELFQFHYRKDDDAHPAVQQPHKDELCDIYCSSCVSPLLPQPKRNLQLQNTTTIATTSTFKKRRKNQLQKVRQVPADGLTSSDDTWSWRKYGQKPIKGSPYPRGYYRCSTLKGCPARKQVERNRTDPNMFIVTYTAEHNHPAPTHRNSLAGTTRINQNQQKFNSVIHPVTTSDTINVSTESEQHKEEARHLSSSEEEGEMTKMIIGDNVDGIDVCGSLWEMGDDFFDGLDGEIENVGNGYR